MAYRKQLKDKDDNVIYPDVGVLGTNSIADNSITTTKLNDGAVSNSKLANGVVSNSKIANGAVNVAKLENGAVTPAKTTFTEYFPTTEIVIGTIKGHPLYRKTFMGNASLRANTSSDITLFGPGVVADIVSVRGKWEYYSTTAVSHYLMIGQSIKNGEVYSAVIQTASASAALRLQAEYNMTAAYGVSIDYTKTADF